MNAANEPMPHRCRSARRRRGLSLVEVLVAGAITAMLLIAVATAYEASAQGVEVNTRFNRAAQTARVGMRRMVEEVRTAEACQVGDSSQQGQPAVIDAANLDLIRTDGTVVSYVFDATSKTVRLKMESTAGTVDVVLARNVRSAKFTSDVQAHPQTGIRRTVRVSIQLEVEVDGQPLYLSGSAVPRREMVY